MGVRAISMESKVNVLGRAGSQMLGSLVGGCVLAGFQGASHLKCSMVRASHLMVGQGVQETDTCFTHR